MALQLIESGAGDTGGTAPVIMEGSTSALEAIENLDNFTVAAAAESFWLRPRILREARYIVAPLVAQAMVVEFIIPGPVKAGERVFHLSRPLTVQRYQRQGAWFVESEALGILASGRTDTAAFQSFVEDFSVLWTEIAQASEDTLTPDAVSVKNAFLELVEAAE
jgi:hypothetical protein